MIRHFFKSYVSNVNKLKITHLAIIATVSLSLFVISHTVYAQDITSFAKITTAYNSSANILDVTGIVYKTFSQNYALTIFDPQGHLISISQFQLSQNNTFSQSIMPSSTLWSKSGNYTVKVASGPQVLADESFYFPGASCCEQNSQGVQAGTSETASAIDSPLKQFRSGVKAEDVKCKEDFMLITKTTDGSPACVKPLTYNKLVLQGWAKVLGSTTTTYVTVNGITYDIPYTIRGHGNKMLYIDTDSPMRYLVVHMESTAEKGELTLAIPKMLLDPQKYGQSEYTTLVDGMETNHTETATGNNTRTLTIPFGFGVKEIEIVASGVGMQTGLENGTLSGNVVLAGGPRSATGPKANYEVDVYATDGITIVGKTVSDASGNYSISLAAGNYTIYAPDYPTRQTHFVSVFPGKNTILNIVYGTGYK